MTMPATNRTEAILYESQAALRLVDEEMHKLGHSGPVDDPATSGMLGDLPDALTRATEQLLQALAQLRETQAVLGGVASGTDPQHTERQLAHALTALGEAETRLVEVAKVFGAHNGLDTTAQLPAVSAG